MVIYMHLICVFMAGFVTAINASKLMGSSEEYHGSWGKVAVCLVIAIVNAGLVAVRTASNGPCSKWQLSQERGIRWQ